jgi:hypothetical protein
MQIHVMFVDEKSCGRCQESGYYWLFYSQRKNKFLKARGPYATRADAIACACKINPSCEIVSWDGSIESPNLITPLPSLPPYQPLSLTV